ncbi:TerD family protein [Streptomyces purpureus]|uniref:TerD family protein n=1 Tax=Streptomyces purpureus TaxID=1951 RepID=UPI0037A43557
MTHIAKGANTPVPTAPLRIAVGRNRVPGVPAVSAAALLLDATGKVRGGADIVLNSRPAHPSGAVRHVGTGEGGGQLAEWLELDLPRIEPAVQRVLIAGSVDGGVFGQVPGLRAQVVSLGGAVVAHYDVTDASSETAFVLGEFYRRDGAWKFRAVGQGYDSGLTGLATDFGVVVGEAPPASGPVPLTGVTKTGSAPVGTATPPVPAPAAPHPAEPVPSAPEVATVTAPTDTLPWGAGFFDFEPRVYSGKGEKTVTVDLPFPPDCEPVILEARVQEYQFLHVQIVGRSSDVFCDDLPEFHSRALLVPPRKGGPLKMKVGHSGKWELTLRPLSAARPIGTGTVQGSAREVFIHTGGAAELKVRATDRHNGWFQLNHHQGDTPAELRRPAEELIHAWNGRRVKEKVRIPEGPLLLVIDKSRHEWEFTLDPLPVGESSPRAGRLWRGERPR